MLDFFHWNKKKKNSQVVEEHLEQLLCIIIATQVSPRILHAYNSTYTCPCMIECMHVPNWVGKLKEA